MQFSWKMTNPARSRSKSVRWGLTRNLRMSDESQGRYIAIFVFAWMNRRHCFRASHDSEKVYEYFDLCEKEFPAQLWQFLTSWPEDDWSWTWSFCRQIKSPVNSNDGNFWDDKISHVKFQWRKTNTVTIWSPWNFLPADSCQPVTC